MFVMPCKKMEPMTLKDIWIAFQSVELPPTIPPPLNPSERLQFDNPFLINYVVYHHYRSLGWVVKSGIKFCVDYLLYKRGPVFHHAECVHHLSFLDHNLTRIYLGWRSWSSPSTKTLKTKRRPPSTSKTPPHSLGPGSAQ
jgi:hypothetical protein